MRILLVAHNFLPAHSAGTEVHTGNLARALVQRGHDVQVLATEKDVARADLSIVRREWAGVPVVEVANNLYYRVFRETWQHAGLERVFEAEVERFRPEVVHFQHLLYLSAGCVELAARRAPVVFTLNDFWLQCPRMGQLLHADGSICHTIDHARCGECLTSFKFAQSALQRTAGRAIARVKETLGVDLSRAAKSAARSLSGAPSSPTSPVDRAWADELAREADERDAAMLARVVPNVAAFVAPSRFLMQRFVAWGIDARRIEHMVYGMDTTAFPSLLRGAPAGRGSGPLSVGFFGTLAPHKGAHVLLEAWQRMPAEARASAQLTVRGPSSTSAEYARRIEALARDAGATLAGPVPHDELARHLATLDLLVVPSTWFENAPLVILEARALRTPLLVSDIGGMAELVEPGHHGEHFRAGDAADLSRALREMTRSRDRLASYYARTERVRSTDDEARDHLALYERVRAERGPSQ